MTKVHGAIENIDRDTFISEVAIEGGFTIQDTKLFLEALERVFVKAIVNKAPLNIRGLGHLTFSRIEPRRGFNARRYRLALKENPNVDKELFYEDYPAVIRINFRLAANLRDLLRPDGKKKIKK
jgi:hypothetical protein